MTSIDKAQIQLKLADMFLDSIKEFNEEMEGDFELMKLKPQWEASVSSFLDAALGRVSANVRRSTLWRSPQRKNARN